MVTQTFKTHFLFSCIDNSYSWTALLPYKIQFGDFIDPCFLMNKDICTMASFNDYVDEDIDLECAEDALYKETGLDDLVVCRVSIGVSGDIEVWVCFENELSDYKTK